MGSDETSRSNWVGRVTELQSRMCNAIKWSFVAAYALALVLLAAGTWGWLGAGRGPLSGTFLIALGMPWTLFIGSVGKFDPFGGVSPAVLAMLAPAINLAILFSICSTLRRRRALSKR